MHFTEAQGFDSALLGCGDLGVVPVPFVLKSLPGQAQRGGLNQGLAYLWVAMIPEWA